MSSWQSMPITSDMDYVDTYVNVVLRDVHGEESLPVRHFPVGSTWSFKVGRGSQNEEQLKPQPHNSWFGSRVMSREHAEIFIDQVTREIKISDLSSMHGTYLHGKRLNAGEKIALSSKDVVTFGTDVVRGENTYLPLQLAFEFEWSDSTEQPAFAMDSSLQPSGSRSNRISIIVDDDDDDDDDDDYDVEFIGRSSTMQRDTKTDNKPTTFSVPDSDDDSEDDSEFDEHERSSPISFDQDDIEEVSEESYYESSALAKGEKIDISHLRAMQKFPAQMMFPDAEQPKLPETNLSVDMAGIFAGLKEFCETDVVNEHDNDDSFKQNEGSSAVTYSHIPKAIGGLANELSFDGSNVIPECMDHIDADEDTFGPSVTLHTDHMHVPSAALQQDEMVNTHEARGPSSQGTIHSGANANYMANDMLHNQELGETEPLVAHIDSFDPEMIHHDIGTSNTTSKLVGPQRSEKLSIHSIINNTDAPSRSQLKRKADELLDTRMDSTGINVLAGPDIFSTSRPDSVPEVKSTNVSEEPPRKLAKIEHKPLRNPSKGKTLLKYTAAVVAGAAVGAVTTVFGLAALPAEYFV